MIAKLYYNFSEKLILEMKKIGGKFNNIEKCWEFNILFYKFLSIEFRNQKLEIEYFDYKNKIENEIIRIKNIMNKEVENNITLAEYQVQGKSFLLSMNNVILNLPLGGGKTLTALTAINKIINEKPDSKMLILCPAGIKRLVWENEIKKFFPNMNYIIVEGNQNQRQLIYNNSKGKVLIVGIETARTKFDSSILKNIVWNVIAIDEASKLIKNHNTISNKFVSSLIAFRKFAITGYVLENSIMDVYGIMKFVDKTLFPNINMFKDMFCVTEEIWNKYSQSYIEVVSGAKNKDMLKEILKQYVFRVERSVIDKELPEMIEKTIYSEMEEQQRVSYEMLKEQLYATGNIFEGLTYLREITDFPQIVKMQGDGGKYKDLVEILDEMEGRTIIFTQWVESAQILYDRLSKSRKAFFIVGETPFNVRETIINEFKNNDNSILICSDVLSYAFNLQFANNLINFDLPFSYVKWQNRIHRIYRKGQTSRVVIINMIAKDSIEERIFELIKSKGELIDEMKTESGGVPNWQLINYLLGKSKTL